MKTKQTMKKPNKGFTMIEMLIVLGIIGTLAVIAIPAYQSYILSTHRKAAIADIMSLQQRLERAYTFNNGAYRHLNNEATVSVSGNCNTESRYTSGGAEPKYSMTINIPAGGQSYTITATACPGQSAESCGNLRINEHDIREVKKGSAAWARDSGCF